MKQPYLERHKYSPEQNKLHLKDGTEVKVGFFNMNYNPTLKEALDYAYNNKLITKKQYYDNRN